jgi:molecular chaperone GrpE (heat shock protein)
MGDEVRTDEEQAAQEVELDEVETLQRERDELVDTLQRVQADFENYRKRAAREQPSTTCLNL